MEDHAMTVEVTTCAEIHMYTTTNDFIRELNCDIVLQDSW